MPVSVLLNLAWRNLWRNYRRTVIMLLAIVLGVWAMIFINAMMQGMVDDLVRGGIRQLPGHAQVQHERYRDDPSIANAMAPPSAAMREALAHPAIVGWSQRLRLPAVVASERDSRGLMVVGVQPGVEKTLDFLPGSIVAGRWLDTPGDVGLVLGRKMLELLETDLGKRVVIMTQDPGNAIADRGFRVVGVFDAELDTVETRTAYVGLETLQAMVGVDGLITEIAILGDDYRELQPWLPTLVERAPTEQAVLPWTSLDPYLESMVQLQDGMILVIVLVIFAVLAFGLVNTIAMAVMERVREFGLMQALGMRSRLVLLLVLAESGVMLCIGLVLGNLLAVLTIRPLESGLDLSHWTEGMEMMGVSATLYPSLRAVDMLLVSALVIVLGLMASLLPAWRASRFDPVVALAKH